MRYILHPIPIAEYFTLEQSKYWIAYKTYSVDCDPENIDQIDFLDSMYDPTYMPFSIFERPFMPGGILPEENWLDGGMRINEEILEQLDPAQKILEHFLFEGKLTAYGQKIAVLDQEQKIQWQQDYAWRFFNNKRYAWHQVGKGDFLNKEKALKIPVEFWSRGKVNWNVCHGRSPNGDGYWYDSISIKSEDLFSCFSEGNKIAVKAFVHNGVLIFNDEDYEQAGRSVIVKKRIHAHTKLIEDTYNDLIEKRNISPSSHEVLKEMKKRFNDQQTYPDYSFIINIIITLEEKAEVMRWKNNKGESSSMVRSSFDNIISGLKPKKS